MNELRKTIVQRATRAGVAAGAAILLVTGAAWHGVAADPQSASAATPAISQATAAGRESYADIVKIVAPAVVTIRTQGRARTSPAQFEMPDDDLFRRFFGDRLPGGDGQNPMPQRPRRPRSPMQRGLGSGVVVTSDGYILTNNHVVEGADEIRVEMSDGRTLTAAIVGTDKPSDLAVLKVSASGLRPLALGNSDAVSVGDVVLAIGNPLGVGQTVTMGIISAKGRSTGVGDGGYEDFLQTDAAINQGNSGGALVSLKGELVGINSQILSGSGGNIGIGFAIPSNMAKHVMEDLRSKGHVTRAQLGVTIQPVTPEMAESLNLTDARGAIISSVTPGSAADRAGLKRGDVIYSFNGQSIGDINTLRNRVAEAGPGSTVDVTIVRDGSEKRISVKLDEATPDKTSRRDAESDSDDKTALGVSVAPLTPELAERAQMPKGAKGLVVQDVNPDGRAADAGVQEGDVIQEVNRQPVGSIDDLRSALRKTTDKPVLLLVSRQGRDLFLTVRPANR